MDDNVIQRRAGRASEDLRLRLPALASRAMLQAITVPDGPPALRGGNRRTRPDQEQRVQGLALADEVPEVRRINDFLTGSRSLND